MRGPQWDIDIDPLFNVLRRRAPVPSILQAIQQVQMSSLVSHSFFQEMIHR